MTIQELGQPEMARTGFTHKAVISYALGDFTAAALTQTYTLATLAALDRIGDAALRMVTALSGGAVATATAEVGKTGTTNQYCTATNVFTGSAVFGKAGDGAGFNQAGGEVHIVASALIVTVTTTVANVAALTAGELHVYFKLHRLSNL